MQSIILSDALKGHENEIFYNEYGSPMLYLGIQKNCLAFKIGTSISYYPLDGFLNDGRLAVFCSKTQQDWTQWLWKQYPQYNYKLVKKTSFVKLNNNLIKDNNPKPIINYNMRFWTGMGNFHQFLFNK